MSGFTGKAFQIDFDWFDTSLWGDSIPTDLGRKHESFKIRRSQTSIDEIYSIIKVNYPNARNVKIKIVKI